MKIIENKPPRAQNDVFNFNNAFKSWQMKSTCFLFNRLVLKPQANCEFAGQTKTWENGHLVLHISS